MICALCINNSPYSMLKKVGALFYYPYLFILAKKFSKRDKNKQFKMAEHVKNYLYGI